MNIYLGIECSWKQVFKSLLLWDSIGNSNWYIFDILAIYIIMYICFMVPLPIKGKQSDLTRAVLVFLFTICIVYILKSLGIDPQWYNTIIIFPVGILYVIFCKDIEKLLWKNEITYVLSVAVSIVLYLSVSKLKNNSGLAVYSVWIILFIIGFLLTTMKIYIHSPILEWFGQHIFSLYILQRLPMIVLSRARWVNSNKYLSLLMSISITIIISLVFEIVTEPCFEFADRTIKRIK